jgi:hypothetical protein
MGPDPGDLFLVSQVHTLIKKTQWNKIQLGADFRGNNFKLIFFQ